MYDPPAPAPLGLAAVLGRLAHGRDESAWQTLLAQIGPDLLRMARRLSGNAALADDVVQEALLQIRDHAGRFSPRTDDPDADARRWLLRLTANTALHLVRGSRRSADRHRRAAQDAPVMSSTAPDAALMHDETATLVRKALATLAEPARSAVVLHHCAGMGYEQVAAELGVPIGTAKTHVHRGLERLRQHMVRLGCTLSLTALVSALDGLSASDGGITTLASHAPLIHSPHHASILALPTSGGLPMATLVAGGIAVIITTAIAIGYVRGADTPAAQPATPAPITAAPNIQSDVTKQLDQVITVDFVDMDLVDALAFAERLSAVKMVIDPSVTTAKVPTVTLKAENMKVRDFLNTVGKLTGMAVVMENDGLRFKTQTQSTPAGFNPSAARQKEADPSSR